MRKHGNGCGAEDGSCLYELPDIAAPVVRRCLAGFERSAKIPEPNHQRHRLSRTRIEAQRDIKLPRFFRNRVDNDAPDSNGIGRVCDATSEPVVEHSFARIEGITLKAAALNREGDGRAVLSAEQCERVIQGIAAGEEGKSPMALMALEQPIVHPARSRRRKYHFTSKKGQFKTGKLGARKATMTELWNVVKLRVPISQSLDGAELSRSHRWLAGR